MPDRFPKPVYLRVPYLLVMAVFHWALWWVNPDFFEASTDLIMTDDYYPFRIGLMAASVVATVFVSFLMFNRHRSATLFWFMVVLFAALLLVVPNAEKDFKTWHLIALGVGIMAHLVMLIIGDRVPRRISKAKS